MLLGCVVMGIHNIISRTNVCHLLTFDICWKGPLTCIVFHTQFPICCSDLVRTWVKIHWSNPAVTQVHIRWGEPAATQVPFWGGDPAWTQVPICQSNLVVKICWSNPAVTQVPILPGNPAWTQVPIRRSDLVWTQVKIHWSNPVVTQVPIRWGDPAWTQVPIRRSDLVYTQVKICRSIWVPICSEVLAETQFLTPQGHQVLRLLPSRKAVLRKTSLKGRLGVMSMREDEIWFVITLRMQ